MHAVCEAEARRPAYIRPRLSPWASLCGHVASRFDTEHIRPILRPRPYLQDMKKQDKQKGGMAWGRPRGDQCRGGFSFLRGPPI